MTQPRLPAVMKITSGKKEKIRVHVFNSLRMKICKIFKTGGFNFFVSDILRGYIVSR